MPKLNFDSGQITYLLNDKVEITFNPTDKIFAKRLYDAFEALDKKQESYREQLKAIKDARELFDFTDKMNREMRNAIDTALGMPVCADLFGDMDVYAMADGLPVWCNLMLAIMDEMNDAIPREQQLTNPRVEKYMKKYKK